MSRPATSPSTEPLDHSRWQQLRDLQQATGRDFLSEIIDLYLNDMPVRLSDLRQALVDRDAGLAEQLAHSIKGSSANIGAPAVEAVAAALELGLSQGSFDGADELLDRIESESSRVYEALVALRPS